MNFIRKSSPFTAYKVMKYINTYIYTHTSSAYGAWINQMTYHDIIAMNHFTWYIELLFVVKSIIIYVSHKILPQISFIVEQTGNRISKAYFTIHIRYYTMFGETSVWRNSQRHVSKNDVRMLMSTNIFNRPNNDNKSL